MMKAINAPDAPPVIGHYSHAMQAGDLVFLSGQIALHPVTMALSQDGIEAQAHQIFQNLSAVCIAAGGSLATLVKLNIYLIDLSHFSIVNDVMALYCMAPYPARAIVEVSALPRGASIEIDGVMALCG
jgi:reactive intermediate/imine deaminase